MILVGLAATLLVVVNVLCEVCKVVVVTLEHVPAPALQPVEQYADVLPQYPYCEQQFP